MKTKYKISIFIAIILIIASLVLQFTYDEFPNADNTGHFNYQDSDQIIPDTYLGKNVEQWQNESNESLMAFYETSGRDEFFVNLGALVVKNAMIIELEKQNIEVTDLDFEVHSGMMLTSLPPHVSFEAYVNSTDGDTYRLSGMAQRAQVDNPVTITKMNFIETDKDTSFESILSKNNTIILEDKNDNQPRTSPHDLIVQGDKDIEIKFENKNLVPIRIQSSGGDWQNPEWYGPTVLPLSSSTMTFDSHGIYEWHSRTLPVPGSVASDSMGGGAIFIMPLDTNKLTFEERQQIGAAILMNSGIPFSMLGAGNDRGITIGFNQGIYDAMPNADEYYLEKAKKLIPFDIPIFIERR